MRVNYQVFPPLCVYHHHSSPTQGAWPLSTAWMDLAVVEFLEATIQHYPYAAVAAQDAAAEAANTHPPASRASTLDTSRADVTPDMQSLPTTLPPPDLHHTSPLGLMGLRYPSSSGSVFAAGGPQLDPLPRRLWLDSRL